MGKGWGRTKLPKDVDCSFVFDAAAVVEAMASHGERNDQQKW